MTAVRGVFNSFFATTWSMTVGDLGVRPRRLHISVLTTICARHKMDKIAVLPVIEVFA